MENEELLSQIEIHIKVKHEVSNQLKFDWRMKVEIKEYFVGHGHKFHSKLSKYESGWPGMSILVG